MWIFLAVISVSLMILLSWLGVKILNTFFSKPETELTHE